MTIEETLRREVGLALASIPAEDVRLDQILERVKSRRKRKRTFGVLVVATVTMALALPQLFEFTSGSEDVSVTVAGRVLDYSEILLDEPVVVRGVEAETPRFDTSAFGVEVPFERSDLPSTLPERVTDGAVFAGSVHGVFVFVYGERIGGEDAFCMTTGGDSVCTEAAAPGGGFSTSSEFSSTGETVYGLMIGDIPATVSVIVYYTEDGQPIGWQTPVAYASYMPVQNIQNEDGYSWEFYDASGQALDGVGNPRT